MKKLPAFALAFGLLSATGLAEAQEFGSKGQLAIGAERLFGFTWSHRWEKSIVPGVPDHTDDVNGISLMWHPSPAQGPYDSPRAAVDYFVIDHLSVGGTIGYIGGSIATTQETPAGTRTVSNDYSAFLFAPRAGYAYMFGSVVGIWPHGGFTYYSYSQDNAVKGNGFALSVDCQFVFAIAPHFALTAGPTLDLPLSGSQTPFNAPERDEHFRQIGIQVGVLGWVF